MNMKYIVLIMAISTMFLISGCSDQEITGGVVENLPGEEIVEEVEETTEKTAAEVLQEMRDEEGITIEDIISSDSKEIILEDLRSTPSDLNIITGDTVKWVDNQKNFNHVIRIVDMDPDNYKKLIGGPFSLLYGDSAEFTFETAGTYYYWSASAYRTTKGNIVVS